MNKNTKPLEATNYVYGVHAITAALTKNPKQITHIYITEKHHDAKRTQIIELARQAKIAVKFISRSQIDLLCPNVKHQGVIAEITVGESQDLSAVKEQEPSKNTMSTRTRTTQGLSLPEVLNNCAKQNKPPLLVILDGVQDPHNLGAVLRSADAAGVDAVIAPQDNAVGLTPAVCKVACGAAETVPFIQVTNLARTLDLLKEQNIWIYGLDANATQDIYHTDFSGNTGIALVFGAEGTGMRRLTREHCDFLIKIPMFGTVASLNISVSAGVALFEVKRGQL